MITTSSSGPVSEPIIADPRLRKLSFTGSTAGRPHAARGRRPQNVLRTSMELGGNAPFVVFDDADLDKAVDGAMLAKFRNIGQACTAANRFIVHASVADEFARRVTERVQGMKIGRGTEDGVTIGPLIDDDAVAKADELSATPSTRAPRCSTGGAAIEGPGTFSRADRAERRAGRAATCCARRSSARCWRSCPSTTRTRPCASRTTPSTAWSPTCTPRDLARGQRMIERLETGMMGLNVGVVSNAAAPFGGVKLSGLGREGGAEGIHEYLETKYTLTPNPFG